MKNENRIKIYFKFNRKNEKTYNPGAERYFDRAVPELNNLTTENNLQSDTTKVVVARCNNKAT